MAKDKDLKAEDKDLTAEEKLETMMGDIPDSTDSNISLEPLDKRLKGKENKKFDEPEAEPKDRGKVSESIQVPSGSAVEFIHENINIINDAMNQKFYASGIPISFIREGKNFSGIFLFGTDYHLMMEFTVEEAGDVITSVSKFAYNMVSDQAEWTVNFTKSTFAENMADVALLMYDGPLEESKLKEGLDDSQHADNPEELEAYLNTLPTIEGEHEEGYKTPRKETPIKESKKSDVLEFLADADISKSVSGLYRDYFAWAKENGKAQTSEPHFRSVFKQMQMEGDQTPQEDGKPQIQHYQDTFETPIEYDEFEKEVMKNDVFYKYEMMGELVKKIVQKDPLYKNVFIYGVGGIGKTFTVEEVIKKYAKKGDVVTYKGAIAGFTGLLQVLWENRDGKVIVFDDNDGILTGGQQNAANLLKGAMEMSDPRILTYSRFKRKKREARRDRKHVYGNLELDIEDTTEFRDLVDQFENEGYDNPEEEALSILSDPENFQEALDATEIQDEIDQLVNEGWDEDEAKYQVENDERYKEAKKLREAVIANESDIAELMFDYNMSREEAIQLIKDEAKEKTLTADEEYDIETAKEGYYSDDYYEVDDRGILPRNHPDYDATRNPVVNVEDALDDPSKGSAFVEYLKTKGYSEVEIANMSAETIMAHASSFEGDMYESTMSLNLLLEAGTFHEAEEDTRSMNQAQADYFAKIGGSNVPEGYENIEPSASVNDDPYDLIQQLMKDGYTREEAYAEVGISYDESTMPLNLLIESGTFHEAIDSEGWTEEDWKRFNKYKDLVPAEYAAEKVNKSKSKIDWPEETTEEMMSGLTDDEDEVYDDPYDYAQQLMKDGYTQEEAYAEAGINDEGETYDDDIDERGILSKNHPDYDPNRSALINVEDALDNPSRGPEFVEYLKTQGYSEVEIANMGAESMMAYGSDFEAGSGADTHDYVFDEDLNDFTATLKRKESVEKKVSYKGLTISVFKNRGGKFTAKNNSGEPYTDVPQFNTSEEAIAWDKKNIDQFEENKSLISMKSLLEGTTFHEANDFDDEGDGYDDAYDLEADEIARVESSGDFDIEEFKKTYEGDLDPENDPAFGLGPDDEIPDRFQFNSRIIFISNLMKVPQPLLDRTYTVGLLLTKEQILDLIDSKMGNLMKDQPQISLEDKKEVLKFMRKYLHRAGKTPTFRGFQQLIALYKSDHPDHMKLMYIAYTGGQGMKGT